MNDKQREDIECLLGEIAVEIEEYFVHDNPRGKLAAGLLNNISNTISKYRQYCITMSHTLEQSQDSGSFAGTIHYTIGTFGDGWHYRTISHNSTGISE